MLTAALDGTELEIWIAQHDGEAMLLGLGSGGKAALVATLDRLAVPANGKAPQAGPLITKEPRSGVLLLWPGAIAHARSAPPLRLELWTERDSGRLSLDLAASSVAQVLGQVRGEAYHPPSR